MLRPYGRLIGRFSTVFLFLGAIVCLAYLTSNDVFSLEETFLTPVETQSPPGNPAVEFASFQSSLVRILSRKAEGRLDMVLAVDSADIEELIQDTKTDDTVTANSYPLEADLIFSNPSLCKDSPDLDLIVYVHTSCKNFDRRVLLRRTWANPQLFKDVTFKVIFLMGRANAGDQMNLKKEFDQYGDIVQGDFIDEYKNLTLKAVMGLKWISKYCPHVPYAMKTDDDSFVNIFEIVRLMKENRRKTNVIMCPLWQNNSMPILRDRKTCMKWCVKRRELPGLRFFPQYCAGIAFILSRQMVKQLYEASKSTPFFWIDDVYVTGLLTLKVPDVIDYVDLNRRMTLREDLAIESYANQSIPLTYDIVHVHDRLNFFTLWNSLLERLTNEQKKSLQQESSSYKI